MCVISVTQGLIRRICSELAVQMVRYHYRRVVTVIPRASVVVRLRMQTWLLHRSCCAMLTATLSLCLWVVIGLVIVMDSSTL